MGLLKVPVAGFRPSDDVCYRRDAECLINRSLFRFGRRRLSDVGGATVFLWQHSGDAQVLFQHRTHVRQRRRVPRMYSTS